jgi:hypothetical protein
MEKNLEPKNRFDLEQEILACWKINEEIKLLTENICETDITKDVIINVLIGIEQLYEWRFNKLWDTFEELIEEKKIIS